MSREGNLVRVRDIIYSLNERKALVSQFIKELELETGGEDLHDFVLDALERSWLRVRAEAAQQRADYLRRKL